VPDNTTGRVSWWQTAAVVYASSRHAGVGGRRAGGWARRCRRAGTHTRRLLLLLQPELLLTLSCMRAST
jgi:hypothetical protein